VSKSTSSRQSNYHTTEQNEKEILERRIKRKKNLKKKNETMERNRNNVLKKGKRKVKL
jgi:hypothetical protein